MTQEVPGYTGESRENQEGPDRTNEVPGRTGESGRTRRVQAGQMRCQDAHGSQREPRGPRHDKGGARVGRGARRVSLLARSVWSLYIHVCFLPLFFPLSAIPHGSP